LQTADILQTIAEVSIGFAGFTSVVAVLGRRATGEWTAIDRFRLSQMLATSLAALLLSLLPLVLAQLGFSERLSWGSASTILAAYTIFLAASSQRRIRQLPSEEQSQIMRPLLWSIQAVVAAVVSCLLINAAGVFFHQEPGPYLLGLYLLLGLSAFQFTRLLLIVRSEGSSRAGGA
jgi:hypothetical protein